MQPSLLWVYRHIRYAPSNAQERKEDHYYICIDMTCPLILPCWSWSVWHYCHGDDICISFLQSSTNKRSTLNYIDKKQRANSEGYNRSTRMSPALHGDSLLVLFFHICHHSYHWNWKLNLNKARRGAMVIWFWFWFSKKWVKVCWLDYPLPEAWISTSN